MKPENLVINNGFAYFSPDGVCIVRSISQFIEGAREQLPMGTKTWKDYEAAGCQLKRIMVNISVLED